MLFFSYMQLLTRRSFLYGLYKRRVPLYLIHCNAFYGKKKEERKYIKKSFIADLIKKDSFKYHHKHMLSNTLLTVVGSGAKGAPASLLIETPKKRYLFNCGQGTLRLSEGPFSALFITHDSWVNCSGFLEFMMGSSQRILPKLPIYGPSMGKWLMITQQIHEKEGNIFCFRPYVMHTPRYPEIFVDDFFSVKCIPLFSSGNHQKKNISQEKAYAYICKVDYNGNTGANEEEIQNKGSPQVIIVLEIPSEDFLEALLSEKSFHTHQLLHASKESDYPAAIFHFSSHDVIQTSKYMEWAEKFPFSTPHVVINENNSCLGYYEPTEFQHILNQIYPKSFPILPQKPRLDSVKDNEEDEYYFTTNRYKFVGKTYQAVTDLHANLSLLANNCSFTFPNQRLIKPSKKTLQKIKKLSLGLSKHFEMNPLQLIKYPEIVFLGTGSAYGSRYRNASCILMKIDCYNSVLMDCGQNSLGQFVRFFGEDNYEEVLMNISVIYISHSHYDHYGGILSLLLARHKAFSSRNNKQRKLYIILSTLTNERISWPLEKYGAVLKGNIRFIDKKELLQNSFSFNKNIYDELCHLTNMEKISIFPVPHNLDSTGIAWEHFDEWKIVYSGDSAPNDTIVQIGKNCDLLIHEATFEDDLSEKAFLGRHCTQSLAIEIAKKMNSKNTILTHFSQAIHCKIPYITEDLPDNVSIAFDFMKVNLDDLAFLPHVYPILKKAFPEEFEMGSKRISTVLSELKEKI